MFTRKCNCRYGDKCRFLHSTQQQTKPNNPFGFGAQNSSNNQSSIVQQPNANPFGFGVQSASQQNGGSNFGASNSFKPLKIIGPVILLQLVESPMHLSKIKTSPRAQIISAQILMNAKS